MRNISAMAGVVGFLSGARSVAAEIPADPPVHTYWTGGLIWVGAEDEHIWLKSRDPVEGKHTYSSIRLPVNRLSPEKEDFKVDSGLLQISVTHGLLYGLHGWPDRKFRVVDPRDGQVVLDHLLGTWSWSYDRHFPYPDGYTDYKGAAGNSPDALFRFDAAALTATERPIYGLNSGNQPSQFMLGAGESWLAFRRWTSLSDQKIVIMDPATLTDRFSVSFDSWPSFGYNTASSNDAVYVVVNDQLLAINGHTGTREVVFDAAATGFWNGSPFAAWGDDLWTYLGGDVRLWRKGNAGKWENVFRGRLPGWDEIPYAQPKLFATSRGLFVKEEHRVHFFSAEASRPVLKPWNTARFSETAGSQALWLELDRPWETQVAVRVKSVGGTATEGLDYAAVNQDVVFQPGQTRVAVPVSITSDLISEAHETIRFELSDPRGLSLPESREGSGVILASGLQLDEWIPEATGNGAFQGLMIERHKDVTAGFVDDATSLDNGAVYLWDSATGQLRGRTPFSLALNQSSEAHFLELDGKLEGMQVVGDSVIWHELNPANGSSLRRRVMSPGMTPRWMALLGGGRVLFAKNELGSSVVTGFVMSADDPPGVKREIEIPDGPQYSVSMAFVCDGRYLVMGWSSSDLTGGHPRFLRWYDARTLEVIGERNVNALARCEPVALRDGMLLCKSTKGVVALRLPEGEVAWQVDGVEIAATGDDYWFSRSGGQLPVARDLATGAEISWSDLLGDSISASMTLTAEGGGGLMASDVRPVGVDGAMQKRHLAFSSKRTRPGVRLMNDRLKAGAGESGLKLALAERTASDVEIGASALPQDIAGLSPLRIDEAPVRLPDDGSWAAIPFWLEPLAADQPTPDPEKTVEFRMTSATGPVPFKAWADLPLADELPVLALHQTEWVGTSAIWRNPVVGMRPSGDRMLAWTGDVDRESNEGDVVYLINPAYPAQASYVQDPAPEKDKRFAVNALLQGNKLIVISRFKKGGGVIDVINASSRQWIKSFVQRGGPPSFGASLASDETYFVVGSPGLEAGKPAGSQVEVYRWSDFKRVFRKTSNKNSRFGEDVVLRDGVLHVTTGARSKVASFSLPKGKPVVAPLPAPEGAALNGEGQHLMLAGQNLRAFSADGALSWSVPNPLQNTESRGRCSVSEGLVVLHHRDEVYLFNESNGSFVTRVRVPNYWSSSFAPIAAAAIVLDRLFILQGSSVRVVPLENAGDFQAWQLLRNGEVSSAEFDPYVASRIGSGSPFARVVSGAQGIQVDSTGTPPPDVLVLVEIEIRPGVWRAVAWREGYDSWTSAAGHHIGDSSTVPWPHGTNGSSAVRVRYAPLSPREEWSEGTIFTPWLDLPLPSQAAGLIAEADLDGDGIPAAIEVKLGSDPSGWDASPLQLETVDGVLRVSHLRPRGDAAVYLESSEDLKEWAPATQDESLLIEVEAENDQFERVTATPLSTEGRKYFRLAFSS